MSKEFKNMDDLFRDAFANEQAEVPAFVKANIDKQIGFAQKRNGWTWFGGAIIAALMLTTTLYLVNQSDQPAEQTASTLNPTAENHTTNLSENTPSQTTGTTQTTTGNESANATSVNGSENATSGSGSENVGSQNTSSAQTNGSLHQSYTQGAHHNADNSTQTVSNTGTGNKSQTNPSASTNSDSGSDNTHSSSNTNAVNRSGMSDASSTTNSITSSETDNRTISLRIMEQNVGHQQLSLTQKTQVDKPLLYPFKTDANLVDANSIERGEDYDPWMISGTAGVGFTHSNYTFPTTAEKTTYENSTFSVPGFEGNLDVKYRLKNSLTFGTGLSISQLVENYSFFGKTTEIDSVLTWNYTPVYDSLDSIIGYDSTSVITIDSSEVTLYDANGSTQATYLHIPFSIGTQWIYNKFRVDLFVQGRFNYLISGKGGYVQNNSFIAFSKDQNQIFKTWYVDLMLGAAVHYQLTDHLYLTGMFRFHPALNELYQNLNFNRSIRSYHAGIGLSINL